MNQLGLSIPLVNGVPWWNTSYTDNKAETLVKEEVNERDGKHQVDYGSSLDYPVTKKQKRNCEDQDDDDDNELKTVPISQ